MYNYQQFQRQQLLSNEFDKTYSSFLTQNNHRRNVNRTFYSNHKKRVDAFVLSAIESPIEVTEYKFSPYDPRSFLKTVKIPKSFRMNDHTDSQRIEGVVKKNSVFDPVPFRNSSLHKFRDSSANIHARPLKFTASSQAVRLLDSFISSRTNQVEGYQPKKYKTIMKVRHEADKFQKENRNLLRESCKIQENQHCQSLKKQMKIRVQIKPNPHLKQLQRVIMPTLHRKAYFNSMKTMLVQPSSNNVTESSQNEKQGDRHSMTKQGENQKDQKNPKPKNNPSQHINRKQNATNAMIKCNLLKTLKDTSSSFRN